LRPVPAAALSTACLAAAMAGSARANDAPPPAEPQTFAERLVADMRQLVDLAIVARPPKLVPPKKLALTWKLAKLGSLDLGGALVALASADLDADGKAELYAVTPTQVVVVAADKKLREVSRIAFAGERTSFGPRDVVGTAVADGLTLRVAVSTFARSMRVTARQSVFSGEPGDPGFPLCPAETAQLTPARNYFGDGPTAFYGVQCSDHLVDAEGHPLRTRAQLSLQNSLDVAVERCATRGLGCEPATHHEYAGVGTAFAVADVDRDGTPDVLASAAGPPGDPDTLRVHSLGGDEKKPRLKKAFAAGGIVGIAVGDFDGNGAPEAVIAVRIVGATRVDLWRLE
jgi:hypothetical protein